MIVGSGLLASAFGAHSDLAADWWIYAAGVSNSGCDDALEFERERTRLSEAMRAGANADAFVYFGTCSAAEPTAGNSPYVRHKIEMEHLASEHSRFFVARLPQLAGKTPNPHTLLNYLHARISRSEKFALWKNTRRNIIDVVDAVSIVLKALEDPRMRRRTVNVANPVSHPVAEIVAIMEKVVGKAAIAERIDAGAAHDIDISQIDPIIAKLGLSFDSTYVPRVIQKYYGQAGEK